MELEDSSVTPGGTLRGFQRHQFVEDLLANPGTHDLTTSVNWDVGKACRRSVWASRPGIFSDSTNSFWRRVCSSSWSLETQQCKSEAERAEHEYCRARNDLARRHGREFSSSRAEEKCRSHTGGSGLTCSRSAGLCLRDGPSRLVQDAFTDSTDYCTGFANVTEWRIGETRLSR